MVRTGALLLLVSVVWADEYDLPGRAGGALRLAVGCLVERIAVDGAYPARVSLTDGARWADGPLTATQFSTAGTAALGLVCLDAAAATGDTYHRDAALAAARGLAAAQLHSGGWPAVADRAPGAGYTRAAALLGEPQGGRPDLSSLAPEVTPAAIRLLLATAAATGDAELRASAAYAVRALVQAQLSCGGWRSGDDCATGSAAAVIEALLSAADAGLPDARDAAVRGGEFLLQTQLLGAVAGWPERVSTALRPVGARVDVAASAGALAALARLQQVTRERRYLAPLRRGAVWLEPLRRSDGDWPTAMDRESGAALDGVCPGGPVLGALLLAKETLRRPGAPPREPSREDRARASARRGPAIARLIATLDADGRWVEQGQVDLGHTAGNLAELAQYVREYEPLPEPMEGDEARRPPQHSTP